MRYKPNILIVAGEVVYPLRASIRDMIYSFKYNPECTAFFYFTEQGPFPEYLKKVNFDLIVFTDTWAGERWRGREMVHKYVYRPLAYLKNLNVAKVVHPQDEWIYTDLLNELIIDFNIKTVLSCAGESEWKKIYNRVDFNQVNFFTALTGYLEDKTIAKIKRINAEVKQKSIDIGYRAFKAPAWLGKHGFLKTQIAEIFITEAPKRGFSIDISTNEKDSIAGDRWFEYMVSCKYFIGVEGGSTVLDRDGRIWEKGVAFQQKNPNATFDELEKECFPGMDGNLGLIAISPRHLEACATKTCQVLVEGKYNNILIPHKHYIELKKDFSNLDEVFNKMKDEVLRRQIVDAAYEHVVESGKYSYNEYTNFVIQNCIDKKKIGRKNFLNQFYLLRNRISEKRFWKKKLRIHS